MKRFLGITLILTSTAALADEPKFLCKPDETLVFGCELGDRFVSVCASEGFSKNTGYVQYRYGTPEKVDFEYPASEKPPEGVFYLSSAGYSGGGANMIRFSHAGHDYFLFDSTVRTNFAPGEPNYPEFTAGLVTRHNGMITSRRLCADNDASIRQAAFKTFEREAFDYDVIP